MKKKSLSVWHSLLCLLFIYPLFLFNADAQFTERDQSAIKFEASKSGYSMPANLERIVFEFVNQKRAENGLPPLVWSERAAEVARFHSANMATNSFFGHAGLDGKRVDDRADQMGLRNWRMIGENIAYNRGYSEPAARVVESWMRSPGHRKNILNSRWKETGIGIALTADGTYYFTQVFLLRN